MWALTRIANAEFWKAFSWNVGTPAARDFLWLTVFFVLSSFLAFLGFAAHAGMWERFEQVLLGALPASSSPVRVSYHFADRPERITARLVEDFGREFPALSLVPMRRFDGKSGTVVLPGLTLPRDLSKLLEQGDGSLSTVDFDLDRQRDDERKIDGSLSWGLSKKGGKVELNIIALPMDSPIWRWVARRSGVDRAELQKPFPLVMAASRTLFSRHFRYDKYRASLVENQSVPCALRSSLPPTIEDPDELKSLVLEVKEGRERPAFHAFDVIWVDSFPMPDQVAIILGLPTVELLLAAESRPKLGVHLESRGQPSQRIQKIWLRDVAEEPVAKEKFQKMATCLGAGVPFAQQPAPTAPYQAPLACNGARDSTCLGAASPSVHHQAGSSATPLACNATWDPKCAWSETCPVPLLRGDDNDRILETSGQWPLRRQDVASCAASAGLGDIFSPDNQLADNILIELMERTSGLAWQAPGRISVPCKSLVEADYVADRLSGRRINFRCHSAGLPRPWTRHKSMPDEAASQPSNVGPPRERTPMGTAWLAGYADAMVYANVRDGSSVNLTRLASGASADEASGSSPNLKDLVGILLNWKPDGSPVFTLDPAYESALVRFGVLSTLIDHISTPLGGGLFVLYLVLSSVILATAFLHRRAQYGLLAMNGVQPAQIQYLICVQIMLACLIGCAIGYVLFVAIAVLVNGWLASSPIIKEAGQLIGLEVPNFLGSLSAIQVGAIWLAMSYISVSLACVLLFLQGISHAKAPIDLIKS
jgi:hypothetical protein